LRKGGFKPPAVTVIGEVARLHDKLNWSSADSFRQAIVVTRSRERPAISWRQLFRSRADVLEFHNSYSAAKKIAPLREAIDGIGRI